MHSIGGMRWTLGLLVVAGCAVEDLATTEAPLISCDANPLTCPGNTSIYVGMGFNEFDATRTDYSPRGFKILNAWHGGHTVPTVAAIGPSLHIVRDDGLVFDGPTVVGLVMRIHHKPTNKQYDLTVHTYTYVPFYAGGTPQIIGYYITYREVGARESFDLCHYTDVDETGLSGTWAVFSKNDRVDPRTGQVLATNAAIGPWVQVGCAGDATVKVQRDLAAGAVAPATTDKQRQADLLFWTASYCGPGQSYTQVGEEIEWRSGFGPHDITSFTSWEAVWNEHGAVCLTTPRFDEHPPIGCKLDPCTKDQIVNYGNYGYVLSANP
jgi:hypothetical protein